MSDSKEMRDLISFLRSRRGGVQETDNGPVRAGLKRRYESRGVQTEVVRLYHQKKDAQVVALVNEIMERAICARDTSECRSADKYAAQLADKALLPVLRSRGVNIPRGYSFKKYRSDWSNLRSALAAKGHSRMRIFVSGGKVSEMARERAEGIIRDVERELRLRVA